MLLKWGEVPDPPVVCAFLRGSWSKELGSTGWDLQLGRLRGQWNGSLTLSGGTGVERWVCSFVTHKPTDGNGASLARETKVRRRGAGVGILKCLEIYKRSQPTPVRVSSRYPVQTLDIKAAIWKPDVSEVKYCLEVNEDESWRVTTGLGSREVMSGVDKRTFLAGGSLCGAQWQTDGLDWVEAWEWVRWSSSSCAVKARCTVKTGGGVSISKRHWTCVNTNLVRWDWLRRRGYE